MIIELDQSFGMILDFEDMNSVSYITKFHNRVLNFHIMEYARFGGRTF